MATATGTAPGKIILIGEHAVVYGHPAVAIPVKGVSTRVEAELGRGADVTVVSDDLPVIFANAKRREKATESLKRVARLVAGVFGEDVSGLTLKVQSDVPVRCGLGSSAALCVATIRALCGLFGRSVGAEEVSDLAYEAEKIFHATPSGIDNSVVAFEQPVYFTKRKGPKPIAAERTSFEFLIADTGLFSSTSQVVNDVRRFRAGDRARYDSLFWEIGSMASVAREVLRRGNRPELGMCMNRNHELLREVGVSCQEIEALVDAAREAGAAGAKLSGAGRGGSVIVLLGEDGERLGVSAALKQSGAREVYETQVGPEE